MGVNSSVERPLDHVSVGIDAEVKPERGFCCCRSGDLGETDVTTASVIRQVDESTETLAVENLLHPFEDTVSQSSSSLSDCSPEESFTKVSISGRGSWHAEGGSYTSCADLAKSLCEGDAVLVWGSWLADLARSKRGAVLPRRQQLPPEAICNAADVGGGIPLLAVSYCWATAAHADPEGQQLRILGQLLDLWLSANSAHQSQSLHSPATCSQDEALRDEESKRLQATTSSLQRKDCAVLLDWCSCYQEPRFADERRSAERFLQQVGRWFAHEHTMVWMLTNSPIGAEPYSLRGWPTFERAVSLLPAGNKNVLDIGRLSLETLRVLDWPSVLQTCQAKRPPPMTPLEFQAQLKRKHVSWSLDRDLLEALYQEVYEDLIAGAVEMPLARLDWGDVEMGQLYGTLSSCTQLQRLDLARNHIGDAGAEKLAETMLNSPRLLQSLVFLDLSDNEIGDLGLCSLAGALPSLADIQSLDLDRNFIGDLGVCGLATALPRTGLRRLVLRGNEIGDGGAGELALAMPRCSNLQLVDLSENEVSDIGAERFAAALPKCDKLQRFDLARNRVGDRGALSLATALPKCKLEAFGLGGHEVGEILGGGRIGDGGAGLLASALLRCERLCKLDLSENQIGDGGTAQLAAAMPHCGQLAELDLYRNCIADPGVGRLAEAVPQCGHLDWLRLLENPVGAKGARRLAEAWEAAGKPKGRLLCQPGEKNRGLAGYAGWASWGSPVAPGEGPQVLHQGAAQESKSSSRTSL
ncbi:Nlrc5 [Symbiodinium natans]|uniref:Nlrc5 protein n=1 Tax=Symbiodinium natans TaxID=878477 RepID=A0A812ULK4_9DINO|nr:Nlrc5 [Symbiodinium natans]